MSKNYNNPTRFENKDFPPIDPSEVKQIVLNHLNKYKGEIMDSKHNNLKSISLPISLENKLEGAVIVEMTKRTAKREVEDMSASQREKVKSIVQNLVNEVKTDGERILVVNVNTPAVDLEKNFDKNQLDYIRNDIFENIEGQLGVTFAEEVKQQWSTAFNAMMDIVEVQKKKPN